MTDSSCDSSVDCEPKRTTVHVYVLTTPSCKKCKEVHRRIKEVAQIVFFKKVELDASSGGDEAIDFAIKYDLNEIPSVMVLHPDGKHKVFVNLDWDEEDLLEAIHGPNGPRR